MYLKFCMSKYTLLTSWVSCWGSSDDLKCFLWGEMKPATYLYQHVELVCLRLYKPAGKQFQLLEAGRDHSLLQLAIDSSGIHDGSFNVLQRETTQTVTQVSSETNVKPSAAPSWPQRHTATSGWDSLFIILLCFTVLLILSTCFRYTLTDVFVQRRTVQMSMSMCAVRRPSSSLSGVRFSVQTSLFSISISLSSEALTSSCSNTQGL